MGILVGSFMGLNGNTYRVTLSGDGVADGVLTFAGDRPVVVGMGACERKFVGFKSQTCRVRLVTDVPLFGLYGRSATDVLLSVRDMTDGVYVFDGYVVPFAYSQPYDGCCDVVEVDAVDRITARKDVRYVNTDIDGFDYGTDRYAMDVVTAIADRAGIGAIVLHANFPDGGGYSAVSRHSVAQAGFLQDEVCDADVLSAVCKFFGLTAHVYGDTLYMYDEHYMTHPNAGVSACAKYAKKSDGLWYTVLKYGGHDVTSPLRDQELGVLRGGVTVNVERAYDAVQIRPEGSDVSVLLPDICGDEYIVDNVGSLGGDERVLYGRDETYDYVESRWPRGSELMVLGRSVNGAVSDDWDVDAVGGGSWKDGAVAMSVYHANITRYDVGNGTAAVPLLSTGGNFVLLRGGSTDYKVCVGVQRDDVRYSHTGGYVRLRCKWRYSVDGAWNNIENTVPMSDTEGLLRFVYVHAGGQRFVEDFKDGAVPVWRSDDGSSGASPRLLIKDGNLLPTREGWNRWCGDVVIAVPNEGQVWVELGWFGAPIRFGDYGMDVGNVWIESLSLEAVGTNVDEGHADMRHEYVTDPVDVLEVSTMLTTRSSGVGGRTDAGVQWGVNARASVVPDREWKADYMGVFAGGDYDDPDLHGEIPRSGMLMRQLRER